MQAHILSSHTYPLWLGQKVKTFFLKVVMLHIKLKGMEHRSPCNHMLCPNTHPRSLEWVKRSKYAYESSPVAYQIKGNGV